MGRKTGKAAKLREKRDLLIELPEGILSSIISLLTLKEAIRTSVLSKRWRYVWTYHSNLFFDYAAIIGHDNFHVENLGHCELEPYKRSYRYTFRKRVDQIINHCYSSPNLSSLTIHFGLGKGDSSFIDKWISCAVTRGVKSIDLDLSETRGLKAKFATSTALDEYELSYRLLASPGRKSTVKHLQLDSCSFNVPPSSTCLSSLTTIKLRNVGISDQMLNNLLSNCLLLEELRLQLCKDLVNMNFSGPRLNLKRLRIQDCFRLEKVEISAENLVRLEYTGPLVSFSFKQVPRLTQAFLGFTQRHRLNGATYAFTRFANALPQLETLVIISVLAMKELKLPEDAPAFTNVKQLLLTICPFDDEDRLPWIPYILKAFPLLQKLQLNLFSPNYVQQPKEIERLLPECPHKHITELEINGFGGNLHEMELLKYLLDNIIALEELTIRPQQKLYNGFGEWRYEEASSWYRSKWASVSEWLLQVIPATVLLKMK